MAKNGEQLTVARRDLDAGRFREAEEACRKLLSSNPQNAAALHLLGLVRMRQHDFGKAIEFLRQAVDLCPDNAGYHRNLGFASLRSGDVHQSVASSRRALKLSPGDIASLNNLAVALKQAGQLDEAAKCLREALQFRPDDEVLHRNLGEILLLQEEFNDAVVHYKHATRLSPHDADVLNGLGGALARANRNEEAIDQFNKALRMNPGHVLAESNLASVLQAVGRPREAISHLQSAVRHKPDFIAARINLGNVLLSEGEVVRAAEQFAAVLELDPSNVVAHNDLGSVLTDLGRFDEAIRHLEEAQRLDDSYVASYYNLGDLALQDKYRFSEAQVHRIRALLDGGELPAEKASILHFTLGGILELDHEYDAAFRCYQLANDEHGCGLQAAADRFDADTHRDTIDTVLAVFDGGFFEKTPTSSVNTEVPVFVVGMPRSGSTLVEQMIASHPQGAGGGELEDIARLVREMPQLAGTPEAYPRCVALAPQSILDDLAMRYLRRLQKIKPGALRIVDKQWHNYLHIGLIFLLFPRARVIHCRRDPMDVCLSCYFRRLEALDWTWKLDDIGSYHRHFDRLMNHWHRVLPNRIFEISYEQLVENPPETCRKMIEFCGLPWSDECLKYHETDRLVRTASRVEVRQPVYTSSVGRWKNYAEHLLPLKRALDWRTGEHIE